MGAREGVLSVADQRIARAEGSFARAQGYKRLVSMAAQSVAFLIAATSLWVLSLGRWDVDFAEVGTIAVLLLRCAGLAQQVQTATSLYGAVLPFIRQVRTQIAHYDDNRQTYGETPFPSSADITTGRRHVPLPGHGHRRAGGRAATFGEGQFIGVLGASGSGKSTLIQVLLRLRAPTAGRVRSVACPPRTSTRADFSSHVAYVPQSPHLIVGTVMENIRFFREWLTEAAAIEAARLANVHDEIGRLPQRLRHGAGHPRRRPERGSVSACPWPAHWRRRPGSWCSTSRPAPSTPRTKQPWCEPCRGLRGTDDGRDDHPQAVDG